MALRTIAFESFFHLWKFLRADPTTGKGLDRIRWNLWLKERIEWPCKKHPEFFDGCDNALVQSNLS